MNYILVLVADIFLAMDFVFRKKYQSRAGADILSGLRFNVLNGFAAAIIFFAVSGGRFEFSVFSLACAAGMALCLAAYTVLGFRILGETNTATYSVFLMSGGMLLPYVFGIFALDEELTLFRLIGIAMILFAVFFSANGRLKLTPKLTLLCMTVFFLNGLVSIVTKVHQINTAFSPVGSTAFTMYANALNCIFSAVAFAFCKIRKKNGATERQRMPDPFVLLLILFSAAASGGSYLFQLTGAKTLPASVLYPLVTGGSIVLSAMAGKIFFGEKLGKAGCISIALCLIGTVFFL